MPVKAEMTPNELDAYNYGFAHAAATNICLNYQFGEISGKTFANRMNSIRRLDGVTPVMWNHIMKMLTDGEAGCSGALTRFGFYQRSQTSPAMQVY
nr:hypothetical protein [uncultured Mediterranean phage uvMED]